jgi:hypothetical protein
MISRGAKQPALNSLAMIWNALQQLEVGQVGVFGFDVEPKLLHPLDAPLTESAGAALLQSLSFEANILLGSKHSSDFALLLDTALGYLDDCKASSSKSGSSSELQQVPFAARCWRDFVSRETFAAFIHHQRRLRARRPKEARESPATKRQTLFTNPFVVASFSNFFCINIGKPPTCCRFDLKCNARNRTARCSPAIPTQLKRLRTAHHSTVTRFHHA